MVGTKLKIMKKIFITLFFISGLLFVSCDNEDTANVSSVTNYATFRYEPVIVIPLGGTYTQDVAATEDGKELKLIVEGSVNTNKVGVYKMTFSATNSDGFNAFVIQEVVVHDPSIVGTDVSGNIRDKNNNARTGVISLVKGTKSIFYCTDFGFSGSFPVYFQMNGNTISEIPQSYINDVDNVDLTYDPISKQFTTSIHPQDFGYTFEYYIKR